MPKKASKQEENFFDLVYQVARLIPKGKVTSYGAIAKYLGAAGSARMVGWAMNNAGSQKPKVPAHRVVNRLGMLSGMAHFEPPRKMQELLEKEGVKVSENQVQDLEIRFWDPRELDKDVK